ncbi:MAG: alpha/beta fold hydrolase [Myxococcota bacterium]
MKRRHVQWWGRAALLKRTSRAAVPVLGTAAAVTLLFGALWRVDPQVRIELVLDAADVVLTGEPGRPVFDPNLLASRVRWSDFQLSAGAPSDSRIEIADHCEPGSPSACGLHPELRHRGPVRLRVTHLGGRSARFDLLADGTVVRADAERDPDLLRCLGEPVGAPTAGDAVPVWAYVPPLERVEWTATPGSLPKSWAAPETDGRSFTLSEEEAMDLATARLVPGRGFPSVAIWLPQPRMTVARYPLETATPRTLPWPVGTEARVRDGEVYLLPTTRAGDVSLLNTMDLPALCSVEFWDPKDGRGRRRTWIRGGTLEFPDGEREAVTIGDRAFLELKPAALALRRLAVAEDGIHLVLEGTVEGIELGTNAGAARDLRPSYIASLYGAAEWRWILPGLLVVFATLGSVLIPGSRSGTRGDSPAVHLQSEAGLTSRWFGVGPHRIHGLVGGDGSSSDQFTAGRRGKPLLLFLNGLPASAMVWRHVLRALPKEVPFLALDLVGTGRSDKPDTPFSLADHSHILDELFRQLGREVRDIVIVAHGSTGPLALELARTWSDVDACAHVSGLVLVEAIVSPLDPRKLSLVPRIGVALLSVGWISDLALGRSNFLLPWIWRAGLGEGLEGPGPSGSSHWEFLEERKDRIALSHWWQLVPIRRRGLRRAGSRAAAARFADNELRQQCSRHAPILCLIASPGLTISSEEIALLQQRCPNGKADLELRHLGRAGHFPQEWLDGGTESCRRIADEIIRWLDRKPQV